MSVNTQFSSSRRVKSRGETVSSSDSRVSISRLPENVLVHMLSLLPMKDAVRTSVLSKEWEYRWASLCNVDIDDGQAGKKAVFLNFVDRILHLSRDIQSFRLSCDNMCDPIRLKTWMSSLSRRNVSSIDISSRIYKGRFLPSCLFDNTSLTRLKLDMPCTFKVPVNEYFSNLKFLFLCHVRFRNKFSSETGLLQLTFPVLESLDLRWCDWGEFHVVEITSPALTDFSSYHVIPRTYDFLFKICGSRLQKFEIVGDHLSNYELTASSVVDVSITSFTLANEHPFVRKSVWCSGVSIEEFSGLKRLRINNGINEVYAQSTGRPLPRFDRLQTLDLGLTDVIETLLEFLHAAPTLEQLIIHGSDRKDDPYEDFNYDEVGIVPSCMSSHLAKIRFSVFSGSSHQLNLVKFLLTNSAKLERIDITVHHEPLISGANIKEILTTYAKGSSCISVASYKRGVSHNF